MELFSEKDAATLEKLKQVMADKATDGDAHAATAFASLLNAETERQKAVAVSGQEKAGALTTAEIPAATTEEKKVATPWLDRVAMDMPTSPGYVKGDVMAPS